MFDRKLDEERLLQLSVLLGVTALISQPITGLANCILGREWNQTLLAVLVDLEAPILRAEEAEKILRSLWQEIVGEKEMEKVEQVREGLLREVGHKEEHEQTANGILKRKSRSLTKGLISKKKVAEENRAGTRSFGIVIQDQIIVGKIFKVFNLTRKNERVIRRVAQKA
jgi:hypothetical protein